MAPPPSLQDLIGTVRRDAASDDAIGQLAVAAAAAAELEETTDALLGYFVDRCRRDGRSWSEISAALGVTKQAVHKRFASAVAAHLIASTPSPTFERFTDRARHVMTASRQIAAERGHDSAGTGHILLGLFAGPEGLAGRTLAALGVSQDHVRSAVDAAVLAASPGSAAPGSAGSRSAGPAFSEEARRALRDALAVALESGHNYIGTEHLLLGLYRNDDSVAAVILADAGAGERSARAHITALLGR